MASKPRSSWGQYAYRVYASAYFAVVGFALLGDLSGDATRPEVISTRASAVAGAVVGGIVIALALSGQRAVALRPTPAELHYDVLSPMPRSRTLARPTAFGATSAAIGGAGAMLAVMLISPVQFGGLTAGRQVGYLAFAAGVAIVGFAAHLLVAERWRRSIVFFGAGTLVAVSVADALTERAVAPMTWAVEALRDGQAFAAIAGAWVLGIAGIWTATRRAEQLPMELISRGNDVVDRAVFAIGGNDLRSILLLQRSITHAWRSRPLVRFSPALARRYPITIRSLRGLARWRYGRFTALIASALGAAALLSVDHASIRTLALGSVLLWSIGLVTAEPFAQENDRQDSLTLLPSPRTIEVRQLLVSWSVAFVAIGLAAVAVSQGRAANELAVAVAGASGATCSAAVTYRRYWKPMSNPQVVDPSGLSGIGILIQVVWPALIAWVCVTGLLTSDAFVVATRALAVLGATLLWITRSGRT